MIEIVGLVTPHFTNYIEGTIKNPHYYWERVGHKVAIVCGLTYYTTGLTVMQKSCCGVP